MDDIEKHCANNIEKCMITAVYTQVTSKGMQLIGQATSIAEVIREFPGETEEELAEMGERAGKAVGTIIRTLFDFKLE